MFRSLQQNYNAALLKCRTVTKNTLYRIGSSAPYLKSAASLFFLAAFLALRTEGAVVDLRGELELAPTATRFGPNMTKEFVKFRQSSSGCLETVGLKVACSAQCKAQKAKQSFPPVAFKKRC